MDTLISAAESAFSSTTGFTLPSLVTWTLTNLLWVWVGSFVAILYELRYVIAAVVIIGAVIYFAYRAFQFRKH
jgi:hypothetical protein